jgi:hypothetical protein
MSNKYLDITPTPRVLAMLGEIDLDWWRCIAEFVDNSVDSFNQAKLEEHEIASPQIHIFIPRSYESLKSITIRDNGNGMSVEQLERSVQAGWTSKNIFDTLGLFGMGFNIATARLGRRTIVWTTRVEDDEWIGIEIDFDLLIKKGSYKVEKCSRPKIEKGEHGTEIQISNLKPDFIEWLKKSYNKTKIINSLQRAYSSILDSKNKYSELNLRLYLNDERILPYKFCIWGNPYESEARFGRSRLFGKVNSYQSINMVLGEFPYCVNCGIWLSKDEDSCDNCVQENMDQKIIFRERKVYGWLGIQRYMDKKEYGIDFIRNGRAIEMESKDFFSWIGPLGDVEIEYNIDDQRSGGRIVGQIHIDHCSVTYTKDHFVRDDKAWKEMVEVVRGKGCLLPQHGDFDPNNDSPLLKLHQAFRRFKPSYGNKPENWHKWEPSLAHDDNDLLQKMAKEYRNGTKSYQTDEKWMEAIRIYAQGLKDKLPSEHGEKDPFKKKDKSKFSDDPTTISDPYADLLNLDISGIYKDVHSAKKWQITAYSVPEDFERLSIDTKLYAPWKLESKDAKGNYYFFVNEEHPIFQSAMLEVLDGLLTELSHLAMDIAGNSFSQIFYDLRNKYKVNGHCGYNLDISNLKEKATIVHDRIKNKIISSPDIDDNDFMNMYLAINPIDQATIAQTARRQGLNEEKLIKTGKFLTLVEPHMINTIFDRETHYFFDGKCWNENFENINSSNSELDELQRSSLKMRYMGMLNDISSVFNISDIIEEKDFLIRINTALRLIELNID